MLDYLHHHRYSECADARRQPGVAEIIESLYLAGACIDIASDESPPMFYR